MRQQFAALPYRRDPAGRTELLLITSRATGRWVVPKGNPMAGLAGHEAAAVEAWEEAGLRGAICPTPLGRYSYRKRGAFGRRRRMSVAVFPMQVIEQAADWPERHQRVTQWFEVDRAAAAVAEPELRRLIAGFTEPPASTLIDRAIPAIRTTIGRRVPMLGWFQSLLPKQGRFFDQFEAHAATLIAGADALARLLAGGDAAAERAIIIEQEHRADDITRDVLHDVRRIFVTPFDRSAISGLIGVMDDAIDQINSFATAITLYEVHEFTPQMRDMGGVIVESARVTAEAVRLLRNIGGNGARIAELTARIVELEGNADRIHADGLGTLFKSVGGQDALRFVIGRELYNSLERVVDRFEDVADEIQGLVIDHA